MRTALGGMILLAVAACSGGGGGGKGAPACGEDRPCGEKQACDDLGQGLVCVPDAVAPTVTAWIRCSSDPCLRNATLEVTAAITDNHALRSASVSFDSDPARRRWLLERTAQRYELKIPLEEVPFDALEGPLVATVTAVDTAANQTSVALAPVHVTRRLWTSSPLLGPGNTVRPLWTPAVSGANGRVVVLDTGGTVHFLTRAGVEETARSTLGAEPVGPLAIGPDALWVMTRSGLTRLAPSDGAALPLDGCATDAWQGAPAVAEEGVVAAAGGGELLVASSEGHCARYRAPEPIWGSPAVDRFGALALGFWAYAGRFTIDPPRLVALGEGALSETFHPTRPFAIDREGGIWSVNESGGLYWTSAAGEVYPGTPSPGPRVSGAIVLADATAVLGDGLDGAGRLRRYGRSVPPPWTESEALVGEPTTPLALAGERSALVTTTSAGWIAVVDAESGQVIWSAKLADVPLQTPNIWTEPGASTSTVLVAGEDGVVRAVLVDGALDHAAPWPKAYHDPQNSSSASTKW